MIKRYTLKRGCCFEIPITLCIHHLERKIREGWTLLRDNGADNLPCHECNLEKVSGGKV